MNRVFILAICLIFAISCKKDPNKSIDEGSVKNSSYTNKEIGWTINIPKGWEIVSMEQKKALQDKGSDLFKGTYGEDIDTSLLKNLIGFKKDAFNSFLSTSEPYDVETDGNWEINNQSIKEFIYDTYVNQGIRVDTTATTIENVGGLDFYSFRFTIYSPEGKLILNQILYDRLINGLTFSVVINYNNNTMKNEMLNAWLKSEFKK